MANNRLYIMCRNCGAALMLDKTFGEPYCIGSDKLGEINKFLYEHADCGIGDPDDRAGGHFQLIDEYEE